MQKNHNDQTNQSSNQNRVQRSTVFSLPVGDKGGSRVKLGELAIAAALNDDNRRVPLPEAGESDCP